jgi:type I restriction enzyme S subunit
MSSFKSLRELVSFKGGGTPSKQVPEYWNGDIPWASVKDFTSTSLSETQDFISQEGLRNSSANLIPKGHVIIPTRMALGKAVINTIDLAINQDLRALVPKVPLDTQFLLHALLSLKEEIVKKGSGATVKGITQEELYKLEIFFPPLDDQVRISHLLSKIEKLIAQRKQHLQQLDDLLKSVFMEMFGDPILNPRGFPIRRLSEFYINPKEGTKCGPFGSALKKEELVETGVPVWNMDNIAADGRMVLPFRMWITADKYNDLATYLVQDEDIIISRAGTVGKMCVARMDGQPAIISTNLIRLRLGSDLRPLYFVSLMLYCKGRVGRLKTGADGAFTHMNTGVLDSLEFPYPSVSLQDQFGKIASKVEGIKSLYQQSLTDLESLYGALSQQAFKGKLDLSRVPLLSIQNKEEKTVVAEALDSHSEQGPAINLPDTDNLLAALENAEARKSLISQWLEAYHGQSHGTPISVQKFMAAAQTRLAELHPDNNFALDTNDYEHIKAWVFKALAAGTLTQKFDDASNRIELRAVQV